jgi:hypothetical protein
MEGTVTSRDWIPRVGEHLLFKDAGHADLVGGKVTAVYPVCGEDGASSDDEVFADVRKQGRIRVTRASVMVCGNFRYISEDYKKFATARLKED